MVPEEVEDALEYDVVADEAVYPGEILDMLVQLGAPKKDANQCLHRMMDVVNRYQINSCL